MNIKNKLTEVYIKYRQNVLDNYESVSHLNVVIIMHPKTMAELSAEERELFRVNIPNEFVAFINLCGRKTPIILDNTLPDDTDFIIKSQKDYEREEIKKYIVNLIKFLSRTKHLLKRNNNINTI